MSGYQVCIQCPIRTFVDNGTDVQNSFKYSIKNMDGTDHDYF